MNCIEINKISDLEYVLNAPLFISLKNQEIAHNTWAISLSKNFSKDESDVGFLTFLAKLLEKCQNQIDNSIIKEPITFYLWFDEMASQLRFDFISGYIYQLPFDCKLKITKSPQKIIDSFLNTKVLPVELDELKELNEEQVRKSFILDVYVKYLRKK